VRIFGLIIVVGNVGVVVGVPEFNMATLEGI
jgi:hypothetical protein